VIEQSVAPERRTDEAPAGVLPDCRAARALDLWLRHADEFVTNWRRGVWAIPSRTTPGKSYEVRLVPSASCNCPDARKNGAECLHVEVARFARKVTAPCSGCGRRFRRRDLVEVGEANVSLGTFVGDRLCEPCALNAGAL